MNVIGTGSYLPTGILSNDDLQGLVETSDEWITSRTGIRNRHLTTGENTSTLATRAAHAALKKARIEACDIELIVVATSTPDTFIPGVSHQVLKNLGIECAMAFDLNAACTGFVYALDVVESLMRSRDFKYGLVIGAEVLSKMVDWGDRNTCVLFGDGAGAVVVKQQDSGRTFLYAKCTAIPDVQDALTSGGLVINNPLHKGEADRFYIQMEGQEVFKFAVSSVCESVAEALDETGIEASAVDYYVLHQANSRILSYVAKRLEIPIAKCYSTISQTGNTSAASIPIVIDEMNEKGLLKKGMKIVLSGFGAGLTYGTIILEW